MLSEHLQTRKDTSTPHMRCSSTQSTNTAQSLCRPRKRCRRTPRHGSRAPASTSAPEHRAIRTARTRSNRSTGSGFDSSSTNSERVHASSPDDAQYPACGNRKAAAQVERGTRPAKSRCQYGCLGHGGWSCSSRHPTRGDLILSGGMGVETKPPNQIGLNPVM